MKTNIPVKNASGTQINADMLLVPDNMMTPGSNTVDLTRAGATSTYAANFTQSGTGAPTVSVFLNQLSGAIVWTRANAGAYVGTLAGAFLAAKTHTQTGLLRIGGAATDTLFQWKISRASDNTVDLGVFDDSGAPTDDALSADYISLIVFT